LKVKCVYSKIYIRLEVTYHLISYKYEINYAVLFIIIKLKLKMGFDRGGRGGRGGGFRGGDRGGRGGRGGFRGGRGGGGGFRDQGPPERVVACAEFSHNCEGLLICNVIGGKVPLLMR
jgi:hypothetical protein